MKTKLAAAAAGTALLITPALALAGTSNSSGPRDCLPRGVVGGLREPCGCLSYLVEVEDA